MKKLSKRSMDFIELFLSLNDMERVSLTKHDVKILYDYYKNAIYEINRLENELLKKEGE
jgi:hypothetical protein